MLLVVWSEAARPVATPGAVYRADDALSSPSPDPLRALTVYEYDAPPVKPSCSNSALAPSSMYTVYPVTAAPLVTTGADHDSEMLLVV
jgi:hypothetical protein